MSEVRASALRGSVHYAAARFSPAACVAQHAEALFYGATPVNAAITEAEALLGDAADHMTAANVTAVLGGAPRARRSGGGGGRSPRALA